MFIHIIYLKLKYVFRITALLTAQVGIIIFINRYNSGQCCNVLRYMFLYLNYVQIIHIAHIWNSCKDFFKEVTNLW